jgi:uncharacterized protein (DUF58 family)
VRVDVGGLVKLRAQASGFSFLPRQPIHSLLAGRHASRLRGRGLQFEEIRGYLPGDDPRSIDWKVTARMRTPHTRVFTEERERRVMLVVDQRRAMFFGSRVAMKSVTAAEAAALGAWRTLAVGDRPGAVVFGDEGVEEIRPHRSRRCVLRILHTLARATGKLTEPATGPGRPEQLDRVLERVERTAGHDALVVLISDLDGAGPETRRRLTRIGRHNDVMIVRVQDPLEAELPQAGELVVGDGLLQLDFDSEDADLRERYRSVETEALEAGRKMLQQRQIPLLSLSTDRPVAEQIRAALGEQQRRSRAERLRR